MLGQVDSIRGAGFSLSGSLQGRGGAEGRPEGRTTNAGPHVSLLSGPGGVAVTTPKQCP